MRLRRLALYSLIEARRIGAALPLALLILVAGLAFSMRAGIDAFGNGGKNAMAKARADFAAVERNFASNPGLLASGIRTQLSRRERVERDMALFFSLAAKEELSLDVGDYHWENDPAGGTARYRILFPVKGSYAAIRRFCQRVLAEMPFVAIDELHLRRESIGENELTAEIRFSLYVDETLGQGGRSS